VSLFNNKQIAHCSLSKNNMGFVPLKKEELKNRHKNRYAFETLLGKNY
jgi:hypothetical protein